MQLRALIPFLVLLCYTMFCGIYDLHSRRLHVPGAAGFALIGITLRLLQGRGFGEVWPAMLPGLLLLLLSRGSRGAVGSGDALYLLVCGLFTPLEQLCWMLVLSLILSAAAALYLIFRSYLQCRTIKHLTLPYLTFMIPALLGSLLFYRPA